MEQVYRILTLNLGSTSTKVALFENEEKVFDGRASHDPKVLEQYANVLEQFDYRVLTGEEEAKEYTGIPVWTGFDEIIATHKEK